MKKLNIFELPPVPNVCDQVLREVPGVFERSSIAHVTMNPLDSSLLHQHTAMTEIYAITRGIGELYCGQEIIPVEPGHVIMIPPRTPHKLINVGMTGLQHFVQAFPPFNPSDVTRIYESSSSLSRRTVRPLPKLTEAIDGARVIEYGFSETDTSFALGCVARSPDHQKTAHYHKKSTECLYIIEGRGQVLINRYPCQVRSGDWISIEPGERHLILNAEQQHLVVLCISSPRFDPSDVYFE